MEFTADRLMALVRQALPLFGGVAIMLGWMTPDQVGDWSAIVLQFTGPLSVIVGLVWSWWVNGKESILRAASKMPEVREIVLEAQKGAPETRRRALELNSCTPPNVKLGG